MPDAIICPVCEAQNPTGVDFCVECDAFIEEELDADTPIDDGLEESADDYQLEELEPEPTSDDDYELEPVDQDEDHLDEVAVEPVEEELEELEPEPASDDDFPSDSDGVDEDEEMLDEVAVEPVEEGLEESADDYQLEELEPEPTSDDDYELEPVDDDEDDLDEVGVEPVDDEVGENDLDEVAVEPVDDEAGEDDLDEVGVEPVDDQQMEAQAEEFAEDFEQQQPEEIDEPDDDGPPLEPHRTTDRPTTSVDPLPQPGEYPIAPTLTVYRDQQAIDAVDIDNEATLFGSGRPTSESPVEPQEPSDHSGDEEQLQEVAVEAIDDEPEAIDDGDLKAEAIDDEPEAIDDGDLQMEAIDDEAEAKSPADTEDGGSNYVDLSAANREGLAQQHVAIYRQNKNYTLYVLCDEPTQINDRLLELGQRVELNDGDIIVLGEEVALKFDLDAA